jgi:hypothetical protein
VDNCPIAAGAAIGFIGATSDPNAPPIPGATGELGAYGDMGFAPPRHLPPGWKDPEFTGTAVPFVLGTKGIPFIPGPLQKLTAAPITLNVNLNGDAIGKAVSSAIVYELEHSTAAPAPNGLPNWPSPDGRHSDH